MSDPTRPVAPARPITPITSVPLHPTSPAPSTDAVICERCGQAQMYRMHAVWRCPACGFKTDCCGW